MTELQRHAEPMRREVMDGLSREDRARLGQFLTPVAVGARMAAMLEDLPSEVRALDAGAGTGNLITALCTELCGWARPPDVVSLSAYEIDDRLQPYLKETLARSEAVLAARGIRCSHQILINDFIADAVAQIHGTSPAQGFNCALVNPPYRKLRSDSAQRRLLRSVGIETSNLYTAFLALIVKLLEPGGQLCAITPRSFCNGPYFLPFRRLLTESMTLRRVHEFTTRNRTFSDDAVLQETVIFTAVKRALKTRVVLLSQSGGPQELESPPEQVAYEAVLKPADPERVIHLPRARAAASIELPRTLADLGVSVATGRVVDFRAKPALQMQPRPETVPLLYPAHLRHGRVCWPLKEFRKPQHLLRGPDTESLLVPAGCYVLVKRFSSKEQRRRVTAALCLPGDAQGAAWLGVENHLNVLSGIDGPLPEDFARGLCGFLSSTPLDEEFRQFSGHTQVNATDLRRLRFPERAALQALGRLLPEGIFVTERQEELDTLVGECLALT